MLKLFRLGDFGHAGNGAARRRPRSKSVAALISSFGSAMSGFIDRTRLLAEACSRSPEDFARVLPAAPVLVYGIYDLNELQLRMISRLSLVRSVTAFVIWQQGASACEFVGETIVRLRSRGFSVRPLNSPGSRAETLVFSAADRQAQAKRSFVASCRTWRAARRPATSLFCIASTKRYDEVLGASLRRAELPH